MTLLFLRDILETGRSIENGDRILEAIRSDTIILNEDPLESIMMSMRIALPSWPLLSDLKLGVIRNHTDLPFIFGDSPAIFYNQFQYQYHEHHGTIGFNSPGLIVILPIGSDLTMLLFDDEVYELSSSSRVVDVVDRPIVSRLNVAQLLSSVENVYFGDESFGEYVCNLVDSHRHSFRDDFGIARIVPAGSMLVEGAPSQHDIMHTFEQQLPISLDLPFLRYAVPPPLHEIPPFRNEGLVNSIAPPTDFNPGASLSVDQFMTETIPRIQLPDN